MNYGLEGDAETLAAIARAHADIVLLQETTPAWEQALRTRFAGRYPQMAFRHAGGAGGLAVLSRWPFEERDYEPSEAGWFPAWRLVADSPLGPLQLLDVHLRPPVSEGGSVVGGYFSTPPVRRAEMEQFVRLLEPDLPTLVAGDFNEGRSGGAVEVLVERGFRDTLPAFDVPPGTWRWSTSLGTVSAELDHIVHGPGLVPVDARPLPLGRSDHLPVYAVFVRRPPPG